MNDNKEKELLLNEIYTKIKAELDKKEKLEQELKKKNQEIEGLKSDLEKLKEQNRARTTNLQNTIRVLQSQIAICDRDIEVLKGEIDKRNNKLKELRIILESPPSFYAWFLRAHEDGAIDIIFRGERIKVQALPEIDVYKLKTGQKLLVGQLMGIVIVIKALSNDFQYDTGEKAEIKGFLDDNRIIVEHRSEQRIIMLAEPLLKIKKELKIGNKILFDYLTGFAFAKLPESEVGQIELETVPDITWDNIGGLDKEIKRIKEEIELPYLYPEEYRVHKTTMPKGALLFGPPGNGKTMLGKALARHLAKEFAKKLGKESKKGNFFLINGPELSSKWVGETERFIREGFKKARQRYKETNIPVVMFIDEADSFLVRRGSRISSDASDDYVTQFCVEIDGVEALEGVIVVLATNRIDKLDEAVMRPGRIDIKIRIGQPNEEGAKDILSKYLTPDLPFHQKYKGKKYKFKDNKETADYLVEKVIERVYSQKPEIQEKNKYVELSLEDSKNKVLYFKDFVSGAALKNIVDRAKKKSIKNAIEEKERGITLKMLYESIEEEFQENEGLPSSREAINEWLKMHGERLNIVGEPKFLARKTDEETRETKDKDLDIL